MTTTPGDEHELLKLVHHQGAVEMSELALEKATNEYARTLADQLRSRGRRSLRSAAR